MIGMYCALAVIASSSFVEGPFSGHLAICKPIAHSRCYIHEQTAPVRHIAVSDRLKIRMQ